MQAHITDSALELVQRLQGGESNAFAELYDNYGSMLFGIITRIVENQEDSENLLQDCFVKIWANIQSFDTNRGRFATWIINIARNTAIDFIRSKYFTQKQKTYTLENIISDPQIYTAHLPIETLGLKKMTEQLNPKYRQIIDWIYFDGFTQQEIADKFNIPLGTVKSRARAAIIELRNYFEIKN